MSEEFKRSQLLINKKFQYKYITLNVLSALVVSAIIGGVAYYLFRDVMIIFMNQYYQQTPELIDSLNATLQGASIKLAVVLAVFVSFIGYITLMITHKASGPIYKLTKTLDEISTPNDLKSGVYFRKDDDFKELETSFNKMATRLDEYYKTNAS